MKLKAIFATVIITASLISLASCDDDNGCIDVQSIDLRESECLTDTLLTLCNSWVCSFAAGEPIFFEDCTAQDCNTLICEQGTLANLQALDALHIEGTLEGQEFSCNPIVP